MTGSVPSIRSVDVPIGTTMRLHPQKPVRLEIETTGGSRISVVVPANERLEILRGTDIARLNVLAVYEPGLHIVDGEEEE